MTNRINCKSRQESIAALVMDALDPDASTELCRHLANCDVCRSFRDTLVKEEVVVRSAFDAIASSVDVEQIVHCEGAAGTETTGARKRILHTSRMMRIAASILATAAVGATFVWMTVGNGGATVAWADVQEFIRNIETMTTTITMRHGGSTDTVMKMMYFKPGRMRQEMIYPAKETNIIDLHSNTIISLSEPDKRAYVTRLADLPEEIKKRHEDLNLLERFKRLAGEAESELGTKERYGRATKGYRIQGSKESFDIWVDSITAQPVEVTMTALHGQVQFRLCAMRFDEKLASELFSTEVPPGYEQIRQQ